MEKRMKASSVVIAIATLLLIGCITKREVITEIHTDTLYNETIDTMVVTHYRIDTIHEYKIVRMTDTIRDVQTRVITLKESGDTIREVINNNLYHYVYQKDSTDKYQAKIDSLKDKITQIQKEKEKIENQKDKEVVKTKNGIWKYVSIVLATLLCLGGLYILWIKLKR